MSAAKKKPPGKVVKLMRAIDPVRAARILLHLAHTGKPVRWRDVSHLGEVRPCKDELPKPDDLVRFGQPVLASGLWKQMWRRALNDQKREKQNAEWSSAGSRARQEKAEALNAERQAEAEKIWDKNRELSDSAVARLLEKRGLGKADTIRKAICKPD